MRFESDIFNGMQYLIRYPDGYVQGEKYPVILFLHGAGTRGNDLNLLQNNLFFSLTAQHTDFPFITVAPLCHGETWFDHFETLHRFIQFLYTQPFADIQRFYMMGASMGGYATWQLAISHPEFFAAIAPVCGGGMYWDAARLINVPIWAFHGAKDPTVFLEESEKMVNAVNARGGNAKLTVYPENLHDAWTDTYSNPEVFTWLLSHTNNNAKALKNEYSDGKKFG